MLSPRLRSQIPSLIKTVTLSICISLDFGGHVRLNGVVYEANLAATPPPGHNGVGEPLGSSCRLVARESSRLNEGWNGWSMDVTKGEPRARDLEIEFEGTTGLLNAITDVGGVEVGHCTIIEGDSVRTGVTAIHPRGKADGSPCFAGWFSLNGNGEMTGTTWIEESGLLMGPVTITNTHSVGVVRDSVIAWERRHGRKRTWSLPVVAETYDGTLNDINGFHVKPHHAFAALDDADSGPVVEGNVGGGTGMICYGYKGGIGTASRIVGEYQVGVLVQANQGERRQLRLPGKLIGIELAKSSRSESGSIIIVIATDAPLLPHQCKALSKRAGLGLGRTGAVASINSGDIFLAFSTGNQLGDYEERIAASGIGMRHVSAFYEAAVQATEEAIWNALVAARTLTGFQGSVIEAFPHDALRSPR
jgi:D-aminopeptidase